MRNDRELLLVAFTAFLAGVVFTLFVLLFGYLKDWPDRLVVLGVLTVLTTVSLAASVLVTRKRSDQGESATPQAAVSRGGSTPSKDPTLPVASAVTLPPNATGSSNPQGRKPEPRWEPPPARVEGARKGGNSVASSPRSTTMETLPPSTRRETEPVGYLEGESVAGASMYSVVDPGRLVEIWESYRRKGEGKFSAQGLQQRIAAAGITADVLPGEQFGAGDNVLAVDFRVGGPLYLLPNFHKPVRTVSPWFQPLGPESRTAVIQRLIRPATARRSESGLDLETKGEIE